MVVEIAEPDANGSEPKVKISYNCMVRGELRDVIDWINPRNIALASLAPAEVPEVGDNADIPSEIVNGHALNHVVNRVPDWQNLCLDSSAAANMGWMFSCLTGAGLGPILRASLWRLQSLIRFST